MKPNGRVLEELLTKTWWTDTTVTTGPDGRALAKAFLGTHSVSATLDGKNLTGRVVLDQAGKTVTVTLQP